MALGKTAQFYHDNPESYDKKKKQAMTNPVWGEQTLKRKKKRGESNRIRRKENKKRKKQGLPPLPKTIHYDHKTKKFITEKKNTGQAEKSRKVGSPRAPRGGKLKRQSRRLSRKMARNFRKITN